MPNSCQKQLTYKIAEVLDLYGQNGSGNGVCSKKRLDDFADRYDGKVGEFIEFISVVQRRIIE